MKELYLDSANLNDIAFAVRTDAVAGVTTNPSLMAKEPKDLGFPAVTRGEKWNSYVKCLDAVIQTILHNSRSRKHLSVEVISLDPQLMYEQAHDLRDRFGKYDRVELHVKIPVLFETLEVISRLSDEKVKVNATAVMNHRQAKLAHDAGASIVSFFYNRMKDHEKDQLTAYTASTPHGEAAITERALQQIATFSNEFNRNSRIICGSIRHVEDMSNCWHNGADIVTASLKIIKEALTHPQTEKAVNQFQEDIDKWLS